MALLLQKWGLLLQEMALLLRELALLLRPMGPIAPGFPPDWPMHALTNSDPALVFGSPLSENIAVSKRTFKIQARLQ